MIKVMSVVKSAVGAALLTLVTAVVTLLSLMFSTGPDQVVERRGFFGAMVFETVKKDSGALGITAGVDNPVPLVVLFLVLTAFLTVTLAAYRGLKQRREQLLAASGR